MRFLQNLAWGSESQVRTLMPNFIARCGFKNVGLYVCMYVCMCPQNRKKMATFGINLAVRKNSEGSAEKVEYRCTTHLPLCNDTIIVLKITLLHSVSIITNFVIPKHDKQTKKHHTSSSTASMRPTIPTILSFATRGYWKFVGKCPHHGKMVITWMTVPKSDQTKKLKST